MLAQINNHSSQHVTPFYCEFSHFVHDRLHCSEIDELLDATTEPVEEIRLQITELVALLLDGHICKQTSSNDIDWASCRIVSALVGRKALMDPYAQLHQCSCRVIQLLARVSPFAIESHALQLLPPLTTSLLGHGHSKTRIAAIHAASSIIVHGLASYDNNLNSSADIAVANASALNSPTTEVYISLNQTRLQHPTKTTQVTPIYALENFVLPAWLNRTISERSASVRAAIIQDLDLIILSNRVVSPPPVLLELVFLLMSDDSNRERSQQLLTNLVAMWPSSQQFLKVAFPAVVIRLSESYNSYSPLIQRISQIQTLRELCAASHSLDDIDSNTLPSLVSLLLLAVSDDNHDAELTRVIDECGVYIGQSASLGSLVMQHILHTMNTGSLNTNKPLSNTDITSRLQIISQILKGSRSTNWIHPLLTQLIEMLSSDLILSWFASQDVMNSLARVITELAPLLLNQQESPVMSLYLLCCMQLLGCPESFGVYELIDEIVLSNKLAGKNPHKKKRLLQLHFKSLVSMLWPINNDNDYLWDDSSRQLYAFDALLRCATSTIVLENLDIVEPVFKRHLGATTKTTEAPKDKNEPNQVSHTLKLSMLALLETSISSAEDSAPNVHSFAQSMVEAAILPNLKWQVGGAASGIRKVSLACLYSLLKCCQYDCSTLFGMAPFVLPTLKSHLDDSDTSNRQLSFACIYLLFKGLPKYSLGEEAVHQLYPALVTGLDDSNDNIRIAACDCLFVFLSVADSQTLKGTTLDYIIKNVMLHMDDPNTTIQSKCFQIQKEALNIDSKSVLRAAQSAICSHQNTKLCQELFELAKQQ